MSHGQGKHEGLGAPPPEFSPMIRATHASMVPPKSPHGKRLGQLSDHSRSAATHKEQLSALAATDVALALRQPPMLHSAGAHSLSVRDTSPVKLPQRKSFLSGVKNSALAQKRWNRSGISARRVAGHSLKDKKEAARVGKLMGLSKPEFKRSSSEITQ